MSERALLGRGRKASHSGQALRRRRGSGLDWHDAQALAEGVEGEILLAVSLEVFVAEAKV